MAGLQTVAWTAFGLLAVCSASSQPASTPGASYRLILESKITTRLADGGRQVAETLASYDYRWIRHGATLELVADRLGVRRVVDGKTQGEEVASRKGVRRRVDGQWRFVALDQLPADRRAAVLASYGVPLVRIRVDADGKETDRTVLAGPAAAELMRGGVVEHARLFTPPFAANKRQWRAPYAVALGDGVVARGTAVCELVRRRPTDPSPLVRVKLRAQASGSHTLGKARVAVRCTVFGRLVYDTVRRRPVAGRQEIRVSYDLLHAGGKAAAASGTIRATVAQMAGSVPAIGAGEPKNGER